MVLNLLDFELFNGVLRKAKMTDLNTVRMAGTGSSKIKSAEFVQSDEDVSSDDGEPSEGEDVKGLFIIGDLVCLKLSVCSSVY